MAVCRDVGPCINFQGSSVQSYSVIYRKGFIDVNGLQILAITNPEAWSPHAVYQATRLFVSNLNAKMAQRFVSLVLLPSVRDDIQEHRRLHFALFQAVKKSTYKPDAFFKVSPSKSGPIKASTE